MSTIPYCAKKARAFLFLCTKMIYICYSWYPLNDRKEGKRLCFRLLSILKYACANSKVIWYIIYVYITIFHLPFFPFLVTTSHVFPSKYDMNVYIYRKKKTTMMLGLIKTVVVKWLVLFFLWTMLSTWWFHRSSSSLIFLRMWS